MNKLLIHNNKQSKIPKLSIASSIKDRMIGLLNKRSLSDDEGLLIKDCKQVHTWFMKFPIDVIFVNKKGEIIGIESLKPWKVSKLYWNASFVIETNFEWTKKNAVELNNKIEVLPC